MKNEYIKAKHGLRCSTIIVQENIRIKGKRGRES
jgi:hypothetical protein